MQKKTSVDLTFQKGKQSRPINDSNWGIIIPVTLQLNRTQ